MLKLLITSVLCLNCFGAFSNSYFNKNDIMLTDSGIFLQVNGELFNVDAITYVGNGMYQVSQQYYGSCGRCGWPRDQNGRCSNGNCNGYGPDRN